MGQSLRAQVAYGWRIEFDEYGEEPVRPLPWDEEDDIDDWWLQQTGFPVESPYGPDGNTDPGEEASAAYWAARRVWLNEHPIPIEIERAGVTDYSMEVIIRPAGEAFEASFEGWKASPLTLAADLDADAIAAAEAFIRDHDLPVTGEFGPHISASYW